MTEGRGAGAQGREDRPNVPSSRETRAGETAPRVVEGLGVDDPA